MTASTGELEIPGFSTYIQAIDRDHLLSIGYDADDQGNFSWFRAVHLQVFNVADMSNPIFSGGLDLIHPTALSWSRRRAEGRSAAALS